MPSRTQDLLVLVARILATAAIVRYGFAKFFDTKVFIDNPATIGFMKAFFGESKAPVWLAYANAVFQTGAGLCVMVGFRARWSAFLLLLWLAALTYFGHPFWTHSGAERATQESYFLRNLAMMGALMMVMATGAGNLALDNRGRSEGGARR
jgi:putative oxidoreductase